jgi:hypothetical protein
MLSTDARELRDPVQVVVVGDDLAAGPGQLDQLAIHLADLREIHLVDAHAHARHALQPLEHVEAPLAAVAAEGVGRVGDLLELAQNELGHQRGAARKPVWQTSRSARR